MAGRQDSGSSSDPRPPGLVERRKAARKVASPEYQIRRRELVSAAAQVFFDKGFNATTIADIAKAAGVDRASVYYYAGSKSDLFEQTIGDVMEANTVRAEEIAESSEPADIRLASTIVELMRSYEEYYPMLYAYVREDPATLDVSKKWLNRMRSASRRYEQSLMAIIESGIDEGLFRSDVPVKEVVYGIIGMTSWSYRWFKPGGSLDGTATGEALSQMVVGGLLRPAASR